MSKTIRLDFSKGINVVGDKAIMPDGFGDIMDNVDLRSGSPRPYKMPEFLRAASSSSTRIWSYRGRWFESDDWRDYVGEYMGGIERVYVSQAGKFPWKVVGGKEANLGTIKPKTVLGVAMSGDMVAVGLTATQVLLGLGNLADGERVYRICAKTKDGVMPPCAPVAVTISDKDSKGASVDLVWGKVKDAISYIIFQGTRSEQLKLDEVNASVLTYSDTGSKTASGDAASSYQQSQAFRYAYTYKRNVNGCWDEGPMSYPSIEVTAESGRIITRDFKNDGFWQQLAVGKTDNDASKYAYKTASGTAAPESSSITLNINKVSFNDTLTQTVFESATSHLLKTGDKVKFLSSDPVWSNQTYDVVYVSDIKFAVKNVQKPSSITSCIKIGSIISYSSGYFVSDDDAIYLKWNSGASSGIYRATKISNTSFSVPVVVTGSVDFDWIPGNAYYKSWCLYRNEQGGWFLVDEIDIWDTTYVDAKPFSAMGGPPSSYYNENGIDVDYDVPPIGLTDIKSHYGMLFGIIGNTIRWTPTLVPDAWPTIFSVTLPYKPTAIESYSQGLIILCQDAIYRLDGNTPTGLSLSRTLAEDGCFAPHSVQKTDRGLIYLSKRGLMLFNGTTAECLTDTRVQGRMFTAPSSMSPSFDFWWMPTFSTRNYADLAGEDVIISQDYVYNFDNTVPIEGMVDAIKSFYVNGKYYIFYSGANYMANTAIVIDMQLPGFPITTMGFKALDAHVDEYEQPFMLFDNSTGSETDNIYAFAMQQSSLGTFTPVTHAGRAIWKFNAADGNRVPLHIRTGQQSFGSPAERKRFSQIEFHGTGTVMCRVYVDGIFVIDGLLTMTETPSKDRRLGIPVGTKGYTVDMEFSGDADIRAVEFTFSPMSSTS